jgi:hypothetical protein
VNSCTEKEIGTNIHAWMDRCRSTVKKAVNWIEQKNNFTSSGIVI